MLIFFGSKNLLNIVNHLLRQRPNYEIGLSKAFPCFLSFYGRQELKSRVHILTKNFRLEFENGKLLTYQDSIYELFYIQEKLYCFESFYREIQNSKVKIKTEEKVLKVPDPN